MNVYHDNSGSSGFLDVISAPYLAEIGATYVHVAVSNVISYSILSYLISTTVLSFPEIIAFSNTHALNHEYALA
jgi:hypothetical protein